MTFLQQHLCCSRLPSSPLQLSPTLPVTMGESAPNSEASEDSSSLLLGEDCDMNGSVALRNLPSGGTVGQHPELGPSSCTQNETLREVRIVVRINLNTPFQENGKRIFEVALCGDHEALSYSLNTDTTSVCAIDKEGNQRLDSSDSDKKLLSALQRDEYEVFLKHLSPNNPNPWYDEPHHSSLLEIACQMKNRKEFVKIILDKSVDPNIRNSATGMPLLHATARSGNLDVLKILLEHHSIDASVTDNKNKTILHWLASVSGKKPGDKEGLDSCFKLVLFSCGNKIIDWKDDEGNTALYIAVKNEFQEGVLLLLKGGADIMLSIHGTPILSSVSTPMLEAILDDCLECNDEPETSQDVKLTFNYGTLNKIMPHMAESPHQRKLLKHHVISCFINMLYEYITYYILTNIFIYSFLLFTLIYAHLNPGDIPLFVLISLWLAAVYFDLFYSYFNHVKILSTLEFILSLPMIFYIVGLGFDVIKNSWIWFYVLAFSSLLASLKLVVMTGRLPLVVFGLEVLKRLRWTIMAGYSFVLIILGFNIYILYKDKNGVLSEFVHALFKIIYTFVFKMETININFDNFPITIAGIFHVFFLPASFILLKLMNGLAWFDTHELRMEAETLSLVKILRILIGCNIHSISQKHFGSNEMKEGKLCVYPHRWEIPLKPLIYIFNNRPCFSHCIRIKKPAK